MPSEPSPPGPAAKRARLEVPVPRPLGREEYLAKLKEVLRPMVKIGAMYNSLVGGIVTDPELMTIPIHDHAIVRGHACFDTCSVVAGRLYRLDVHLDRHLASVERARIPLPLGAATVQGCKEQMRSIVAQTVVASGLRDASVRYYTSVGPGNFGVVPKGCTSAFYVVVMGKAATPIGESQMQGVHEYTVDVPLKPSILANTKSNNYMLNVLTAMASQDKGGGLGVLIDGDGNIAESCVLNCVFVTHDRRLITPPFDKILAGTTVRKIMDVASKLVDEGLLTAVSQEQVPVATARGCVEMFMSGGDQHIVPVTHWDDKPVGSGEVGPVVKRIRELVDEDAAQGNGDHYELSYS